MSYPVLKTDTFADSIFYSDGKKADPAVTYYRALQKNPALAMIAAKVHDMGASNLPIDFSTLCVIIHNAKDYVGFQISLADDARPEEVFAYNEFGDTLDEVALTRLDIQTEKGTYVYAAQSEQSLLDFVVAFGEEKDYTLDAREIGEHFQGDLKSFHASIQDQDCPTWRQSAKKALAMPWVMAALPERIYTSGDDLLREAYIARNVGIYTPDHIQHAIDARSGSRRTSSAWSIDFH